MKKGVLLYGVYNIQYLLDSSKFSPLGDFIYQIINLFYILSVSNFIVRGVYFNHCSGFYDVCFISCFDVMGYSLSYKNKVKRVTTIPQTTQNYTLLHRRLHSITPFCSTDYRSRTYSSPLQDGQRRQNQSLVVQDGTIYITRPLQSMSDYWNR